MIRELNKSKRDNDKITELSIFSHGTASNVAFGYENTVVEYTDIENPTNMNNYNIGQLSREDFANSARIDLYHVILLRCLDLERKLLLQLMQ